ncbi:MAG: hypothetical protein AAGJ40_14150 [Planctomycetota bacterium]
MAKKRSGPNKSKSIRDFHASNPSVKPKEMSALLAKKGVDVTPAFISTILSTDKRKGGTTGKRGRPSKKTARAAAPATKSVRRGRPPAAAKSNGEISLDSLIEVKKIVDKMGGVDDAKNALLALEKLIG